MPSINLLRRINIDINMLDAIKLHYFFANVKVILLFARSKNIVSNLPFCGSAMVICMI